MYEQSSNAKERHKHSSELCFCVRRKSNRHVDVKMMTFHVWVRYARNCNKDTKLTNDTIHNNTLPLPGIQDAAGQTEQKHNIVIQQNLH